jgi:tetrahydromethanopterin S-methyltransferase subunit C
MQEPETASNFFPSVEAAVTACALAAAAQREIVGDEPTTWFRAIGVGSWLVLGMAGVLALALLLVALVALVAEVAIPLAIAAVLAATLVPLTDRLERWRVPRWLGATLVLIFGLALVVATVAVVIRWDHEPERRDLDPDGELLAGDRPREHTRG